MVLYWPVVKGMPYLDLGLRNSTFTYGLKFNTRQMSVFTTLYFDWYIQVGGKQIKVLPPIGELYHLITPVALAHWIMCDGTVHSSGLTICTDAFNPKEIGMLVNLLRVKFGLEATMHKRCRIYIPSKSIPLLLSIIKPHLHSSMAHKIPRAGSPR